MKIRHTYIRDAFIESIYRRMKKDDSIFFLCADFGSPVLDKVRAEMSGNFINVGIAEQNLINVSVGLAMEGFSVYSYAIAPFLTMRAYEQIRNNISLLAQTGVDVNVNLIGVGAGLSYDVSGPTHHCLEDLAIMRALPNIMVFSPCDTLTAEKFADYSVRIKKPKYIRIDGKPLPAVYTGSSDIKFEVGFSEIKKGRDICVVSTGYMTHRALEAASALESDGISAGVVDVFMLKSPDEAMLCRVLRKYRAVISVEEGFAGKGGLDGLISGVMRERGFRAPFDGMGFGDSYVFTVGSREYLHKLSGLDTASIVRRSGALLRRNK